MTKDRLTLAGKAALVVFALGSAILWGIWTWPTP